MTLRSLIDALRQNHLCFQPASSEALDGELGKALPDDLLEFYSHTNGAMLHRGDGGGFIIDGAEWEWSIASFEELEPVTDKGYIDTDSPLWDAATGWLGLVDVQDADWLAIDVRSPGRGEIIDCFHETVGDVGYNKIVARSFTELLGSLLSSKKPFWLQNGRPDLGVH